jgi:hypothetical protein
MPEGGGAPKTGLKISFILLGLVIVASIVCYVYYRWHSAQRYEALMPRLGADSLVKGLRQYQNKGGQFPDNLRALEERGVWKPDPNRDLGPTKTTLSYANYYYIYSKVTPLSCAVWAIPSGPRREEGSTHFLMVWPEVIRHWKGPALSKTDIEKLEPVPSADVLKIMGMTEQQVIDQRASKSASVVPLASASR